MAAIGSELENSNFENSKMIQSFIAQNFKVAKMITDVLPWGHQNLKNRGLFSNKNVDLDTPKSFFENNHVLLCTKLKSCQDESVLTWKYWKTNHFDSALNLEILENQSF